MYKEGQNFLEFVSKKYGEDKILEMIENVWRFNKFEEVIEFTLNEKIDKIDADWEYSLKQKYYPLYKDKTPHFIESTKITNEGFNFSPNFYKNGDNKEVYFIGNRSGYTSVYKMNYDPDSSDFLNPEKIIEGESEAVFEAFHLTKPSMSISRKGTLAFVTKAGATDALHLYDTLEEEIIKTYKFTEVLTIESPSFSNDGNKIVFHGTDRKGYIDIYILELDSGSLKRITNDYYADRDPIFNSTASKIIFSSDRTSGEYQQKMNLFEIDINRWQSSIYILFRCKFNIS